MVDIFNEAGGSDPNIIPAAKPGYKTTEFWISLLVVLMGFAVATGLIPSEGPWNQAFSIVATILGSLGYTVARALVKVEQLRQNTRYNSQRIDYLIATQENQIPKKS